MNINKKGFSTLEQLIVVVIVLTILAGPLSFWTSRNLDFWITHSKGHPTHVPFWISIVLSVVFNAATIFVNVIAEIARYCI